ncbi:uncharacterized protein CMC5_039150 [Chondromyces crocatus]|uniref:Uncharacterized protein n=1 Tax=Chondromyces crocatus TaxID=52 RepID=A0A0K1EFZ0_CHOCO|nr:uncharacterized protein CMC5_039150 [Chondromyces crocatus]
MTQEFSEFLSRGGQVAEGGLRVSNAPGSGTNSTRTRDITRAETRRGTTGSGVEMTGRCAASRAAGATTRRARQRPSTHQGQTDPERVLRRGRDSASWRSHSSFLSSLRGRGRMDRGPLRSRVAGRAGGSGASRSFKGRRSVGRLTPRCRGCSWRGAVRGATWGRRRVLGDGSRSEEAFALLVARCDCRRGMSFVPVLAWVVVTGCRRGSWRPGRV